MFPEELEKSTHRLPPVENHYGYGVIGIGLCPTCSEVRTLYVHSLVNTHDEPNGLCHGCMSTRLGQFAIERQRQLLETMNVPSEKSYYEFLYRLYCAVYAEWSDVPQHTRQEILEHEQGCPACAKFFLPDTQDVRIGFQPIKAYSLNNRSEPHELRLVHRRCSGYCDSCEKVRYIPYGGVTYFSTSPTLELETRTGDSLSVCVDCFRYSDNFTDYHRCQNCQSYVHMDNMYQRMGDNYYCSSCEERIFRCGDCDEEYWDDDGHDCPHEEPSSRTIHSYDFIPRGGFTFHGQDVNKVFLGFELEVEAEHVDSGAFDECADYAAHQLTQDNRGYLKYDGSLNHGFEIVTQPHTLEAYDKFPFHVITELRDDGFRSWDTDTCGFHVHVSRTAFGWNPVLRKQEGRTEAHMLRFTKLIYDNQYHVRKIAGRSSSQWASFDDAGRLVQKIKHGHQTNGRYSAVNTNNSHTLEVRVFRGSMRIERIRAYIEFVHSAVEYTRNLSVSPNNNTLIWGYYRKWLHREQAKYPHLTKLLQNLPRTRSAESELD